MFSDKDLALKTAKKVKGSRFKVFKTQLEAEEFSKLTAENTPMKLLKVFTTVFVHIESIMLFCKIKKRKRRKDTCTSNQLPVDCILSFIQLVMKNNHFQFNNDNYLQKMGTAMGSPLAATYASLFMG